jgi:membrane fusion protein
MFAVSIISFLATATVARKETVNGTLAFSLGELRIVPTRAGIVRALYVSEGQEVERDQPLALVSTEQQLASGDVVDQRVLGAINAEQQMLEARLAALNESAPLEQQALAERLRGARHQIEELAKEIPIRQERLALSHEAAEVGKDAYNRGVMSGDNLRQRQYERLTQEQATDDFKAQIAQLEAQAAADSASLAKLPSDTAQTRAQIQQEIVALEEKRANTSAQNGFILKAPAAGHVTSLQARIGQPVDPSKPLMTVVPTGSDLRAEIYVPSRAIGFIQPGQQVRLFYDAFPHERFGLATGWIEEVSASVLRPDEVTGSVAVKEPVYRAIVVPEKSSVNAYGTEIPLRSGMSLTADIILEDRSFLKLMLDPLRAAGSRVLGN